jgi:glycosyltransferase involved in cell wall biosynthesis
LTVSVCIAARNETHALAHCLQRVLKSDYPKLEILVLDDSSTDDTSLIIKSFAHAGVRFIPGRPLPEGWLGKNHAYQTLIDEASGDLVLFIDVDTNIGETTVSQLVTQLNVHGRSMISVLPRRNDGLRPSAILGTMRYYWELLLTTAVSPPASSALWMVRLDALQEVGVGLKSYGMSVRPERHLARQLQREKRYHYLIGTPALEVGYEKRLLSQYETALRLYYPMNGRSLLRFGAAVLFLGALLVPLIILVSGPAAWAGWWALGLVVVIALTFGSFTRQTYAKSAWVARTLLGPLLVIQEFALLVTSYWQYRLGRVTWKGRLVNAQPARRDSIRLGD